MIKGQLKTEKEYRAVKMDSSSSLKEFSVNRKKYYKKYILGEKDTDEEDSKASVVGRLVETLLLEPELFDERFYMSSCITAPSPLMLLFVQSLAKHTQLATNEFGEVTRSFEDLCRDAYAESGFKIKFEAVINKFVGTDAEIYYKELREVNARNLTVVTADDVTNAEKIVTELKTNFATSEIINLVNSARYEVYNQHQVEGFIVDGHQFKGMMDKLIIDHEKKTIQVYDLKCVWSVEGFYEEYYLYRRAYIQAYLYWKAATHIKEETDLKGYFVAPPKFIVCDSTNYYNPLVYELHADDLIDAYEGFEHKGRTYPGVKQLIQDLEWAVENDVWNISKDNYENQGHINIKG